MVKQKCLEKNLSANEQQQPSLIVMLTQRKISNFHTLVSAMNGPYSSGG